MNHVICIGVDKVDGLTPLTAAAQGAIDFEAWAKSQNYSTTLFTDNEGQPVYTHEIFKEINRIVTGQICTKLIIYFAGHGILKSPNQEQWLLTDARNNFNESINVAGSIDLARISGIPYIVFISDACRILPNELALTGNGSVIFSTGNSNRKSAIDLFYATRPGNVANEFSSKINSERFGLFTKVLLEILNGSHHDLINCEPHTGMLIPLSSYTNPDMAHKYADLTPSEWVIKSPYIETPLVDLVEERAAAIKATLNQSPDITIQYQANKPYLSIFAPDIADTTPSKTDAELASKHSSEAKSFNSISDNFLEVKKTIQEKSKDDLNNGVQEPFGSYQKFTSVLKEVESRQDMASLQYDPKSRLIKNAEKIFASRGKQSFETHTGFTIVGQKIADVLVKGNHLEIFTQYDAIQVRILDDTLLSALILLPGGKSIPVAILSGYIGTLVFEKGRLLTINYTPSGNTWRYGEFKEKEDEIKFARAFVASAANEGFNYGKIFANEFKENGHWHYQEAGSLLRMQKAIDPSLGIYASYAYLQEGKTEEIQSVYNYMLMDNDTMPFDVAMLANNGLMQVNNFAPFCPMLALGWAYRQKFEDFLHPDIREASLHLVPNLWTTFDKKGTRIISKLFEQNLL